MHFSTEFDCTLQLLLSLGDYYAEIPPLRNTEVLNARS